MVNDSRFLPMMPMAGAGPGDSPANEFSESIEGIVPDPVKMAELRPPVIEALKTVYDPEIPVNIYEMGLIYDVLVDANAQVGIRMTLTAPACPAAQTLPAEVRDKSARVPGVSGAKVEIVWEPPWTKERMSDAAKLQLGLF
jgi:FeS assembly SUF system protein